MSILAYDDDGTEHGPVTLSLAANGTEHFNSDDLEDGNEAKGLSGGIGSGQGDWRLELGSESKLEVLAYVRTDDGFVTTMHEAVPSRIHSHRAAVFNPASNANQVSSLRLVNPGDEDAEVSITGIDGDGLVTEEIRVTVPAKASKTLTAQELEGGGSGFEGSLGDGAGKWQLEIEADRPITAMSLLESPTGHLTNLSTAPGAWGLGRRPTSRTDRSVIDYWTSGLPMTMSSQLGIGIPSLTIRIKPCRQIAWPLVSRSANDWSSPDSSA